MLEKGLEQVKGLKKEVQCWKGFEIGLKDFRKQKVEKGLKEGRMTLEGRRI